MGDLRREELVFALKTRTRRLERMQDSLRSSSEPKLRASRRLLREGIWIAAREHGGRRPHLSLESMCKGEQGIRVKKSDLQLRVAIV